MQSNGIPNHCYSGKQMTDEEFSSGYVPATHQIDFSVKWNTDVLAATYEYSALDVDSSDLLTDIVCTPDTTAPSNIPTDRGYTSTARFLNVDDYDGVTGVMIDNGLLYRPVDTVDGNDGNPDTSAVGYDGLSRDDDYPEREPDYITDECGMQVIYGTGILAYRGLGTCLNPDGDYTSTGTSPRLCKENDTCYSEYNLASWAQEAAFTTATNAEPLGIARDGHIIVGPYNEEGELWGCDDIDVCNGAWLSDNSYAYALTTTFPYGVGCWGGRAWHVLEPVASSCSNHRCLTGAMQLTLGAAVVAFASLNF